MTKIIHSLYIAVMVLIVLVVTAYLSYTGYNYYMSPLEERFYLDQHDWLKPSGIFGQGLGIIGTLLMLVGVVIYILRKRYNLMGRFIRLKYLLEFHIFLCTLGPIMILFHTAFKFGGIVSIAFWSMVAVVLSGVVGRFIYIQIPRTIEGKALNLAEAQQMRSILTKKLNSETHLDGEDRNIVKKVMMDAADGSLIGMLVNKRKALMQIRRSLRAKSLPKKERNSILKMVREEIAMTNKIERLQTMQRLFKYWHVAHLPFALIMLIIVVVHVGVSLAFGYTWIF